MVNATLWLLDPGETDPVPILEEAGWWKKTVDRDRDYSDKHLCLEP